MQLILNRQALGQAFASGQRLNGTNPAARLAALSLALLMAGCAAQPTQKLGQYSTTGKFDKKYGVATSPRVVADGQVVPQGGGNYMVGKPYTIAGKTYYPSANVGSATGMASWYGADFHGRKTANGEIFDKASITAAHPTMPLPSYARVTNLRNNHSIVVRVNDRGPYHGGRIMDVSERVADALDFKQSGTARVKVDYLSPASIKGSDYGKLLASLRQDGTPATLDGSMLAPTMIAEQQPRNAPIVGAQVAFAAPPARPAAPVPVPVAVPQRLAVAVQAAEPADEPNATSSVARATPVAATSGLALAPLPPSRPFDLGTIPGAGVPIVATVRQKQAGLVRNFASADVDLADRFEHRGPFEGLKPQKLRSRVPSQD